MGEWQSIETAPKDGTPVLLYIPSVNDMVTAKYLGRQWVLCEFGGYAEDGDLDGDPTHWMPLPSPPERDSGSPPPT